MSKLPSKKSKESDDVEMTDSEFIMETIKYLLANKKPMSLAEKRKKFGMAADCDLLVVNGRAAIIVDNPLPDDDMAILITNKEKIIDLALGGVGKRLKEEATGVRFFEEDDQ